MKKLHLGSGGVYKQGWVNIDLETPEADMNYDLTQPLPFEDASVQFIYSEHFIEHIGRNHGYELLCECRRVLAPDGVIRLSTPDLAFLVDRYRRRDISQWSDVGWSPDSACNLLNQGMRLWGHTYLYDEEELARMFMEAGFARPRAMQWGQSPHKELQGLETRPYHRDLILEVAKSDTATKNKPRWRQRLRSVFA